ncbi:peptide deformylase [Tsuneonella sp. HG222]
MAIREILEVPDPRLKIVSKPVEAFDDGLKTLVDDMFDTMYAAHGIGLAAIQVGEPLRLLVIDLQEDDPDAEPEECHSHGGETHYHQPVKNDPRVFVNPEILDPSEDIRSYQEGCLSVPDIYADVERPARCRVRWQDLAGKTHEEEMEGMLAVCIQHEMDHLEGILFIDHLSRLKRQMALKKLDKLRKAA